ncbi:protein kinase [Nocardioides sp.]|uniref:serine/threonine-protein kinase n=1 Tax=Nocardioides sp. TaxID=35761 RepID=UPI00321B72C0
MPTARRLGSRYEVGDPIGRGGMADVYRGHDPVLGRDVALKVLRDSGSVDAPRFADEARLLATLNHPGIVTLLDAGVTDETPWLALELVEGEGLDLEMSRGPMDEGRVRRIGAAVAAGLDHAHSRGIVHRDVKPSNVLITPDGSAKLTDFGIARLADSSAGLTRTGHTVGTAAYLSPEQVRGETVIPAGDVYSLGLLLLEALTAVRAYPGPPVEAALARLHRAPLIPASLPPGWASLLTTMTSSDAALRPDAGEVARRLAAPGAPLPVTVAGSAPTGTHTTALPLTPTRRRRPRPVVAALAAAALVVAALVLVRLPGGEAPASAEVVDATPTASAEPTSAGPTAPERRAAPSASPTSAAVAPVESTGQARTSTKSAKQSGSRPQAQGKGASRGKAKSKATSKSKGKAKSKSKGKGKGKKR